MSKIFVQLSFILVLLSNGYYINTYSVIYIDMKNKLLRVNGSQGYLDINENDIKLLKSAMGVFN